MERVTSIIRVYVTPKEKAEIVGLSRRHNLSSSALLRALVLDRRLPPTRESVVAFRAQSKAAAP